MQKANPKSTVVSKVHCLSFGMIRSSLRSAVRSPGEVVPGSRDPGSGGLHSFQGGEVWIVTCACKQASWWLQQQPLRFMLVSGVHADSHGLRLSLELV